MATQSVTATQDQANSTHELDLSTASGIVASALIPSSLWSTSASLIQGYATGKGLTTYDYDVAVGQSLSGFNQSLTTLAQVEQWIDDTATGEGTTAGSTLGLTDSSGASTAAAAPAAVSGISASEIVGGLLCVGALGVAWYFIRSM